MSLGIGNFNLNSIIRTVTQSLSPVVSNVMNQISSATNLLKQVIGSGFDPGRATSNNGIFSNLPGPLSALGGLSKYLGPLAGSFLTVSLLKEAVNKLFPRGLENGQEVTPRPLGERDFGSELSNISDLVQQILQRLNGGAAAGTGAATGAATGALPQIPQTQVPATQIPTFQLPPGVPPLPATIPGSVASTVAAATGGNPTTPVGGSLNDIIRSGLAANNSGFTTDQQTMLDNVTDPKQKAMMAAQFRMQNMQETCAFISNCMKKDNEIKMSMINNYR